MTQQTSGSRPFAVVTGASSGIGLELARQLLERGHDVLVCAEDAELDTAADQLRAGADGAATVQPVRADLTTADGVETLVSAVTGAGRPLDVLALNAGVANAGPFLETPIEGDLEVIDLNVTAVVRLAKALVPRMVERGEGRVLITASSAATQPGPWYATYAASKSFVLSFAEAIRHELKNTGVSVTALMPGPTDTEFFDRAGMEGTAVDKGPKDDPAKVATAGLDALFAGRDKVMASAKATAQAASAAVLPDKANAAMHGAMTKPRD